MIDLRTCVICKAARPTAELIAVIAVDGNQPPRLVCGPAAQTPGNLAQGVCFRLGSRSARLDRIVPASKLEERSS